MTTLSHTFDPNSIPKHFIFPHSERLYFNKINNSLIDLPALPSFTNTHYVSPKEKGVNKTKIIRFRELKKIISLGFNREQHSDYCKKHFARFSNFKKKGRELHFNSKYNQKLFYNKKTGKYGIYKENLAKKYKEDFILTKMLWNQIEKEAKEKGLVGVFFTATVVGELHPFSRNGKFVKSDFDYELNFKYAYQELQKLHQDIRIQANRTVGYSPTYCKATEYHKTYIPHSHTIYFVRPEDIDKFLTILDNKTVLNSEIGRTDIQVLNKHKDNFAVPYLLKYLQKTALNMSEDELKVFDGWKRALGIKQLYSNSKLTLSKWIIKKARYYFGETTISGELNKDYWKNDYDSLYECIRANVKVVDKTFDINNQLLRDRTIEPTENEKIRIERDRTMNLEFINVEDKPFLLRTTYQVKKFIVKKIYKNFEQIVFNKSHYEMVEMDIESSSIAENLIEITNDLIESIEQVIEYNKWLEYVNISEQIDILLEENEQS